MKTPFIVDAVICSLLAFAENTLAQSASFALDCSPTVATNPTCVVVADVNGDGEPDLICASSDESTLTNGALTVLTNDGTGVFNLSATIVLNGIVPCVVATDVNGDGKPDLVCEVQRSNQLITSLVIFTNDGSGGFISNATINIGPEFAAGGSLAAADLTGDGKPDLLVAVSGASGSHLIIYTNNGSGAFGSNAAFNVPHPLIIVTGDFNGDGKNDVVCGGEVFLNNGHGILTSNFMFTVDPDSPGLIAVDVNGDGKPDLVSVGVYQTNALVIFTNNGAGVFKNYSNSTPSVFTNIAWIAAADLLRDKREELITAERGSGMLIVLTNNGGSFGMDSTVTAGGTAEFVLPADVNGDGKPDLIILNGQNGFNADTITVLTNATVIPSPALNIVPIGNQSAVFWPATPPWNYVLQTTTNLASTNWTTVTNGTTNICLTITNASPAAYYRLQLQ